MALSILNYYQWRNQDIRDGGQPSYLCLNIETICLHCFKCLNITIVCNLKM